MIKNLVTYQEKDKERIGLLLGVEGGRVKREINAANRIMDEARSGLLSLENDAKELTISYNGAAKTLAEHVERIEKLKKQSPPKDEDEIQSSVAYMSTLLQKVNMIESQLESIAKNIAIKARNFEDQKNAVMKAQSIIKNLTPQYQKQLDEIKPKLDLVDAELKKIAATIDSGLVEKYKSRRKAEPFGKISDIVVPVASGRCGGCRFEMPLSLVHKISTDGYIVCEECGKLIYDNARK